MFVVYFVMDVLDFFSLWLFIQWIFGLLHYRIWFIPHEIRQFLVWLHIFIYNMDRASRFLFITTLYIVFVHLYILNFCIIFIDTRVYIFWNSRTFSQVTHISKINPYVFLAMKPYLRISQVLTCCKCTFNRAKSCLHLCIFSAVWHICTLLLIFVFLYNGFFVFP